MENLLILLAAVSVLLSSSSLVASTTTDNDNTFNTRSYLSTAMRLSVPGYSQDPSEDEILKDIEDLDLSDDDTFTYDSLPSFEADTLDWDSSPASSSASLRYGAIFPTLRKRYNEFIGKRSNGNLQKEFLNDGRRMYKKWAEFVGKRYQQEHQLPKRYMEFLGKRSTDQDHLEYEKSIQKAEKRYAEFLG
ncbi:hypothetical protein ACF0H5_014776 [Mactra antiquata]